MTRIARLTSRACRYPLGLAIASLPLQAMAMDFTPDASRVLSDPSYLPLQGQVNGTTQYNYSAGHAKTDDSTGAQINSINTHSSAVSQELQFGVTDDIAIGVVDSYDWNYNHRDRTGSTTVDNDSDGFTDPSFEATWRMVDQRNHFPVSWDLFGAYAPDLIDAKQASATDNGTVARGGDTATVGTAVSWKTRDFTVYGGRATHFGDRDIENQTTGLDAHHDSNWQYGLVLATQTRLSPDWSVNAGATEVFNNTSDVTTAGGTNFTSDPGNATGLNAALNYQWIPNRLVSSLLYNHVFNQDSHNNYAVATSDTTTHNQSSDSVGVNLQYTF